MIFEIEIEKKVWDFLVYVSWAWNISYCLKCLKLEKTLNFLIFVVYLQNIIFFIYTLCSKAAILSV